MSPAANLFEWMVAYVRDNGQAPTAAQIRDAADSRQPGGIERLCSTLETLAVLMAKSRQGKAA